MSVETTNKEATGCPSIRMVIQRFRHASLLIDESTVVEVGVPSCDLAMNPTKNIEDDDDRDHDHNDHDFIDDTKSTLPSSTGILVYVSFAKTANSVKVEQALKTLLNLPILTLGAWGDGSGTKSILQLSAEEYSKKLERRNQGSSESDEIFPIISLVIVPQANLIAKVKKLGKSVQYRDQIAKATGKELYELFVHTIKLFLMEHYSEVQQGRGLHLASGKMVGKPASTSNSNTIPDPSIPPERIFHQDNKYGVFEEDNEHTFPLTYANGETLTKSARKKLQKVYKAHVVRHAKYLEKVKNDALPATTTTTKTPHLPLLPPTTESTECQLDLLPEDLQLNPSFVRVIGGTFGKRQGLSIQSDMGPFCHVTEID